MPSFDFKSLVEEAKRRPVDAELARRAIGLVDLTSLRGDESATEVRALCWRAVTAGTAAVCLYPPHQGVARSVLDGSPVRLAVVANFPDGGDDIARAAEEAAAAVAAGADEIDVVAPLQALRDGDVGLIGDLVEACRAAIGPATTLKLILETGIIAEPSTVTAAARTAVMAGVDFLKTSTGKAAVGATLEAATLLLSVIAEADGKLGFKAAGGIRTIADAAPYLALADLMLGAAWATPRTFRFGASSLLDDLERVAAGSTSRPASGGTY